MIYFRMNSKIINHNAGINSRNILFEVAPIGTYLYRKSKSMSIVDPSQFFWSFMHLFTTFRWPFLSVFLQFGLSFHFVHTKSCVDIYTIFKTKYKQLQEKKITNLKSNAYILDLLNGRKNNSLRITIFECYNLKRIPTNLF